MNKNKLKIAQVVSVFPPYAGGIGTATANYAKYLSKYGHSVTVFTPAYEKNCIKNEIIDGYRVERLQSSIKFGNAAIMNGLRMRLNEFDIIDLQLPFLGTADSLLFLKMFKGIQTPIISHYHMDLLGKNPLYQFIFNIQQKIIIPAEIRMSKKVILSSLDYLQNSKINNLFRKQPDKFTLMPYGVNTNHFFPTIKDTQLVNKLGLKDKKVILFVGGLDEAHYFKGINYLLEAFAKLSNDKYRLVIIGKGNLRNQYEDQARDLGILKKTIFTGFVTDNDLPKYYNLCDIFVLPSINRAEAFGIVLTEAMACGKPTVASNLPGVREVFGKYQKSISCKPMDSTDLARKIKKVFDDKKLYKNISQNNLSRIRNEYSWDIIAAKLVNLYLEVLKI